MSSNRAFSYDVFISYRWITPDQEWVRERLYPALKNSGLKVCLDVRDFVPGRDLIVEMERGLESRHVVCVISPEYFEEGRMVEFESLSMRRRDPGGRNSSLIPLIFREAEIPERIRGLIPIYWTNPKDHEQEWIKLLGVLGATNMDTPHPDAIQLGGAAQQEKPHHSVESDEEPEDLDEDDWEILLERINDQKCTPFIGPGIYPDIFPFSALVKDWSRHPQYPFADQSNLTLAAQFRSILIDPVDPKNKVAKLLSELATPDFKNPKEPHRILAGLPFSYYITTNYDDFMFKALQFQNRKPHKDKCRWDDPLRCEELSIFKSGYVPEVGEPLVFHLYGYSYDRSNDSLVLTEDDYLDFLANISRYQVLIPPLIQSSFTDASVLLLGYRLDDWNFRILFRTLVNYLRISRYKVHLSVQLAPGGDEAPAEQASKARSYFKRYLKNHNVRVSWKTCQQFVEELRVRWERSGYGSRTKS